MFAFHLFSQEEITEKEIYGHIHFLTSEKLAGRYPGTKANDSVVAYILNDFTANGITVLQQEFEAMMRKDSSTVKTFNVIGLIKGNDPILKDEFIVLGAHYDHLGKAEDSIYYGADDNASGTASLLEIGEKLSLNREKLKRSMILIAFGAEEQGLLGSKFFVENPLFPLERIKMMINLDMVGRLNEKQQVFMGGAGTFPYGVELMKALGKKNNLNPVVHVASVGGSDHVSFYKKKISVLGLHTGGHPQYHQTSDTLDLINLKGQVKVSNYVYDTIVALSNFEELFFIYQK